jgi:hypothetical protein
MKITPRLARPAAVAALAAAALALPATPASAADQQCLDFHMELARHYLHKAGLQDYSDRVWDYMNYAIEEIGEMSKC